MKLFITILAKAITILFLTYFLSALLMGIGGAVELAKVTCIILLLASPLILAASTLLALLLPLMPGRATKRLLALIVGWCFSLLSGPFVVINLVASLGIALWIA